MSKDSIGPRVAWGLVLWSLLSMTAGEVQGGTERQEQDFLHFGDFGRNGRPADFYRGVLEVDPSICQPILSALNVGSKRRSPAEEDLAADLLLASELSASWRALGYWASSYLPFSRVDLDMNGDGIEEVIYRRGEIWGPYMPHRLFWHGSAPTDESQITFEREKEVLGGIISTGEWESTLRNQVSVLAGFVGLDGVWRRQTIHPPLPEGLELPGGPGGRVSEGGSLYDIALLNGRAFVLKTSARYYGQPRKPEVFVFSSLGPRRHKFECLFRGKFEIRSQRRVLQLRQ